MMKHLPFLLLFTFCLFSFCEVAAQRSSRYIPANERFSTGVVFGYNNTQIDGDYHIGFDKYGLTGGIRGIARFTPQLDLNIEMLYSKKGSKILQNNGAIQVNPKKSRIIDLTYIDAPIYFKWLLNDRPSIWHVEIGGIYSRLIKTSIAEEIKDAEREFVYESIINDFKQDDISVLVGFGYSWQKGFAVNLRYVYGVKKIYENENYQAQIWGSIIQRDVDFLRNYYYSLNFSYTIFQRSFK